jgi:predicted RNase H-like HicB family nuclease
MTERQYTVILEPDLEEGGYSVTVPALPGCHTQGDSLEEAVAMARDAIACWIASAKQHGEPIPEETNHPQAIIITVAA